MPEESLPGAAGRRLRGGLRLLDPRSPAEVRAITRMHLDLLAWGPMAGLGELFLERYCYSVLVREGLMQAAVFEVDARPAGFVAYTHRPRGFLAGALIRHPLRVARLLACSVARDPRVLRRLGKAFRAPLFRLTSGQSLPEAEGEILAIGVYPEYLSPGYIRDTGLRIARELFYHVVEAMKMRGIRTLQMDVDEFNKEALLFYHVLGGCFLRFDRGGDSMYRILFDLRLLERGD